MVIGLYAVTLGLSQLLDFFPPNDRVIETLRGEATAIRFILDHPRCFMDVMNLTTNLTMVRLNYLASLESA